MGKIGMNSKFLIVIFAAVIIAIIAGITQMDFEDNSKKVAETVDMSSKELKSAGNAMSFSDFADNFSTCSSATFKHTMITDDGYPIYVIANITDDCKIHVIHDNREDKNTDVANRKLIEAECDKLKLEDDYIDFKNCIISEDESASIRVWK